MALRALIIDNGIGADGAFPDRPEVVFDRAATGPGFAPDLSCYDLLVVPNGSDHVAMFGMRDQVREMLDAGKAVFCFCGWFTDWVPGNRWIHDNEHPTREMRHFAANDPHGLLQGFDLAYLDHNQHGISGWWACGYIETADPNSVLVRDTWGRAVIVADESTTPGFMFLTASGPVGDFPSTSSWSPLGTLYRNALDFVIRRMSNHPSELLVTQRKAQ